MLIKRRNKQSLRSQICLLLIWLGSKLALLLVSNHKALLLILSIEVGHEGGLGRLSSEGDLAVYA